ncbi:protocatechuate 3,4-dioxygenase subunit alpha [Alphaproteobacteria bacterium]|nr:protocatechuate 3,4-dioxygenase subunit alpha [Alphaproteobacteria bacterium]
MNYPKNISDETPFQTAGPFLHIGCLPNSININGLYQNDLGEKPFINKDYNNFISISGSVFDGEGQPLDDVMIETWQSDENGAYLSGNGFARFVPNNVTKKYYLSTIKPGSVQNFEGNFQSPHILFSISSRGINMNLNTRMYFEGDNLIKDPLLSLIKKGNNDINSLIAKKIDESSYIFDIFLQGKRETIFLDV